MSVFRGWLKALDGAAFHTGDRLRRDRFIREKLAATGWKVVVLRRAMLNDNDLAMRVTGKV